MVKFDEKAVIGRIIELRTKSDGGRGKSKFARRLGLSPSTYNYYEKERLPPIPILLRMCEITGADLHWLLTGHLQGAQTPQTESALDAELIEKLHTLLQTSPESEGALLAFIELLGEKKGLEKSLASQSDPPSPDRPGWIPVLGRTAAGMVHFWKQTDLPSSEEAIVELEALVEKYTGRAVMSSASGRLAVDLQVKTLIKELKSRSANLIQVSGAEQVAQFVECREIYQLFPDAFALQIDGDSMAPRINDGDFVILSPSIPAAQGHVAVARLTDQIGVTCKLIRTTESCVHLIPINERYDTKTVPHKELLWALAVLCHIKI